MPKSFNRSPPLGRQLQTPPVSSKAQQRTAGVRRATDSPTERRGRGRRAQRAGMRLGNHLDSTKCVGIRSVGSCSCRPPASKQELGRDVGATQWRGNVRVVGRAYSGGWRKTSGGVIGCRGRCAGVASWSLAWPWYFLVTFTHGRARGFTLSL